MSCESHPHGFETECPDCPAPEPAPLATCEECPHFCRSECQQDGFDENPWSPDMGLCPYLKK